MRQSRAGKRYGVATPRGPGVRAGSPTDTGSFAALRVRDFRLLLMGTTLTNAAQWMQQVTLGWLVYDLTSSGALLGSINMVRFAATLALAVPAGAAIDRAAPRALMLRLNGLLFAASVALGLLLLSGHRGVWALFVFAFISAAAQTFDLPLRQTVVFSLVPRSLAPNAVALIQTGWGLMRSVGPGLAGFLILWCGPGGNFLVQAGAYALVATNILRMKFPAAKEARLRRALLQDLREGLRHIADDRMTRNFVLMSCVLPLFIIPNFVALPPIYAKKVFHGGPQVLGFLLSAAGVGGVLGGIVTASLGSLERRGLLLLGALLCLSLSLIGFAFSSNLWVALPLLALAGFFEMIHLTTTQTILQLSIPDELRGRITSIVGLSVGLTSLGSFFAGAGSDFLGVRIVTTLLCSAAAAIALLVFLCSPTVRGYRLSRAIAVDLGGDASSLGGW